MTPSSAAPVATPRATATPGRQIQASRLRRTSEVVLVVGTVLAVGAALGPTWLVRVGVGIAVTAAVVACVFAWREMFSARRIHASQMLESSQQHGRVLREERTRNGEVVDTLTRRATQAGVVIDGQQRAITTLRSDVSGLRLEVSGLRGDRASLIGELAHRDTVITSLRSTVRSNETELADLRAAAETVEGDETETSVRHMPRRVLAEHESAWADVPDADDLWADGSHPAVVDLRLIDTAMVLPNYEVDRRVG